MVKRLILANWCDRAQGGCFELEAALRRFASNKNQWHILWYLPSTAGRPSVSQAAKLFANGRSQAVRLPAAFRFDATEVFIRKDALTGDVILSRRPHDWDGFLVAAQAIEDADGFLSPAERLAAGHTQSTDWDPLDAMSKPLGH